MAETVELAPKPASVRSARVFTAGVLGDGGVEASVIELAVLLVSELVTNAAVHAGSTIRVTVHVDSHWVRVEVEDEGRGQPVLRRQARNELQGRGLAVVDRLSTDWGADRRDGRKVVWFEIAR
jgi:anti-sigma regulatory factor (Ser/Thr protein kinase)